MWRRNLVATVAFLSIGCSAPGTSIPDSVAGTTMETSSFARTSDPTTKPSPSSTVQLSERERSDRFWEGVSDFAPHNYSYDTLAEITEHAHLIVRGRVIETRRAQYMPFDAPPEFNKPRTTLGGVIAIDEVVKGEPQSQTAGSVLVMNTGWERPAEELPDGEVLLFLVNIARLREEEGHDPSSDPNDRFLYARPNGYQCVLRNFDGTVRIVDGPRGWEEALGPFPAQLDGEPFDDLLDRVRALVANA